MKQFLLRSRLFYSFTISVLGVQALAYIPLLSRESSAVFALGPLRPPPPLDKCRF